MTDPVAVFVALACYGVGIVIAPELPSGRRAVPIAALGPALIALGPAGFGRAPISFIVVAVLAVHVGVTLAQRRRLSIVEVVRFACVLSASAITFGVCADGWRHVFAGQTSRLLVATFAASMVFPAADVATRWVAGAVSRHRIGLKRPQDDISERSLLHALFASTGCLVVLAFAQLGPASFVVLLLPLFATHISFTRFSAAQRTYFQTVRALGRLAEAAGYVPVGHHQRVAELSVAVAHELGLRGPRVRKLELVALLHDVGKVAVQETDDSTVADPQYCARAGARVLEGTGYLSREARILAQHAAPPHDAAPVDSRILRIASRYDELAETSPEAFERLAAEGAPEDYRVIQALGRVRSRLPAASV